MTSKRHSSARYAIIGLMLAALGCVGTAGLAIVRGAMALGLYKVARPDTLSQGFAISIGLLVVGVALYGVLNPSGVRRFVAGRQARYGSNALVMSLAFVGIVVVVNWLVYQNPKKFDWSEGKQHTLAPETLQALDALPAEVLAKAFYTSQYPADAARSLLADFKSSSKGKFDFEFVDPNADPLQARNYGITGDGKIVLIMGEMREIAAYADENTMTQALIRLISPASRAVYFLTGHGEPDLDATDTAAMLRARETLETKNYTVDDLNLAATNKIPEDATAIVVAGATEPLLDQEVDRLEAYLAGGGALLVLADPAAVNTTASTADPLARYLSDEWGITLQDTLVIDLTSSQPMSAISATYSATSPITTRTTSFTIMPQARSLAVAATPPENVRVTPLILTADQSWGETDLAKIQSTQEIAFDEALDLPGPLTLAASAENSSTKARVVVFGDSNFARNEGFDAYANGDIFINALDWAAEEDDLINITPKTPVTRTFNPPGQLGFFAILFAAVALIPGLVLVAGISSWLARRRRG